MQANASSQLIRNEVLLYLHGPQK